jgi:hypothetical protein
LRQRGFNADKWRLRVENAHGSAELYCVDLRRHPHRYPELLNAVTGGLKEEDLVRYWSTALEPVQRRFEELLRQDQTAKQEELDRQNEAFAKGLPVKKQRYPFSVEFPDRIPILKNELLAASRSLVEHLESERASGETALPPSIGPPQTIRVGGIPSSFKAGEPHLTQQLDFRERRHSIYSRGTSGTGTTGAGVPADEELKGSFGRLAHAAIVAVTRRSSVPLGTVDDWIDYLAREGYRCGGDIEKLLIASREYLEARSDNELGLGNLKKAKQLRRLAARFGELHVRFYKRPDAHDTGVVASSSVSGTEKAPKVRNGNRRGRRPNQARRDAIRNAIRRHGDQWRDHLTEIFSDLDSQDAALGSFQSIKIELPGATSKVMSWVDLDLTDGEQRKKIIDILRKYVDRRI